MDSLQRLPSLQKILSFAGAIAGVLLLVYGKSLLNGFVTFDDDILVFNNHIVQSITGAHLVYIFTHFDPELYIPLTFLHYQIDWLIGGGSPFIFHSSNLLLHAANALLAACLFLLLTRRPWVAAFGALIFAVHPLNTEAVAWISARKDLLSTFFFLLSVLAYLFYANAGSKKMYIASILAFALGLFAKVMIVTLPVALLLIDILQKRPLSKKMFTEKIPYLLLSVVFGIVALFGKQGVIDHVSLQTYLLMAAKSTTLLLQHFFLPAGLSLLYPFTGSVSLLLPAFYIPLLLCILLFLVTLFFARKHTAILFGASFFVLTLIPTFTNISKDGDLYITSDRYAYLPMLGLLLMIGMGLDAVIKKTAQRSYAQTWSILLAVLLLLLGSISYQRSLVWQNTYTLFADAILKAPNSSLAHNKVGSQLLDEGRIDEAEKEFRTSIALKENARAHYNLGLVYLQRNDMQNALQENIRAIDLNPSYAPAHVNLGYLLWQSGHTEEAITHFRTAIENENNTIDARMNLAVILLSRGENDEAQKFIDEVLAIDPGNSDALKLSTR